MSTASDITAARIVRLNEEGFRGQLYDDETGRLVHAPVGKATIGYGMNCESGISEPVARAILALQLNEFEGQLLQRPWYTGCDDVRRSALLELAFNEGMSGFINGFPKLIAAVGAEDWPDAEAECTVKNENVKPRYARIGQILLSGIDA